MNLPAFMQQGMPSEQLTIAEILKAEDIIQLILEKWHLGHRW